eukprot:scaffold309578_cov13-Prasinocladus_malaysianus.AAC.1
MPSAAKPLQDQHGKMRANHEKKRHLYIQKGGWKINATSAIRSGGLGLWDGSSETQMCRVG